MLPGGAGSPGGLGIPPGGAGSPGGLGITPGSAGGFGIPLRGAWVFCTPRRRSGGAFGAYDIVVFGS